MNLRQMRRTRQPENGQMSLIHLNPDLQRTPKIMKSSKHLDHGRQNQVARLYLNRRWDPLDQQNYMQSKQGPEMALYHRNHQLSPQIPSRNLERNLLYQKDQFSRQLVTSQMIPFLPPRRKTRLLLPTERHRTPLKKPEKKMFEFQLNKIIAGKKRLEKDLPCHSFSITWHGFYVWGRSGYQSFICGPMV